MANFIREKQDYDEPFVLANYLWANYAYLFPPQDQAVMLALIGETKAVYAAAFNEDLAKLIRSRFGSVKADSIAAELKAGDDAFRARACRDLLASKGSEIFINRCGACNKIVRTPKARQCLWCGFDWHTN